MSLTPEERKQIYEEEKARLQIRQELEAESTHAKLLDTAIVSFTNQGFVVENRTDTSAQLRKPKQFNGGYAIVNWLLLSWVFGLGIFLFILQVILHLGAKDQIVMLAVENGTVVVKGNNQPSGVAPWLWRWEDRNRGTVEMGFDAVEAERRVREGEAERLRRLRG